MDGLGLPLPLGAKVKGYGKIVGYIWHGERYYVFEIVGGVSLIPASAVESSLRTPEPDDGRAASP